MAKLPAFADTFAARSPLAHRQATIGTSSQTPIDRDSSTA